MGEEEQIHIQKMFSKLKYDKKEADHIRPDEDDKVWGKLSCANIFLCANTEQTEKMKMQLTLILKEALITIPS